jgi:hypothetical protein
MQMTENQRVSSTKDLVGRPVEVRVLFRALLFKIQGIPASKESGFFVLEIFTANEREGEEVEHEEAASSSFFLMANNY